MKSDNAIGFDCCNQPIIPRKDKLSIKTNAHPNTDGSTWGWIEGCTLNICWSNNKKFNRNEAGKLVYGYNNKVSEHTTGMKIEEVIE